jgi:L-lactate dehydrogenase complex protein LldG
VRWLERDATWSIGAAESGADGIYEADAGLSEAGAAVAETGSIVCRAGVGEARGISLVPQLHLAIVRKRVIVADMLDCVRLGWAAPPPSALVMVTGPSKTADIEGVLVRGVHGPGRVVILMVGRDRPAGQ